MVWGKNARIGLAVVSFLVHLRSVTRVIMPNSLYKMTPEIVERVCEGLRNGLSRTKAAEGAGITRETLRLWCKSDEDFAVKVADAEQEYREWCFEGVKKDSLESLKTLICGTEYDETETKVDKEGNKSVKVTHKVILPNVTALIFALCNRDPEHWQNKVTGDIKQEVKSASLNGSLSLDSVPDDLLGKVLEALNKK